MTTQIVLVPGFWLGAWAWEQVAGLLEERGLSVTALTLPGLDPADRGREVTLDDQAAAIAEALQGKGDRHVLVVHSGAALPGTMVLDQHPDLVDHVVFVDTAPVRDGFAMNPELPVGQDFTLDEAWDELEAEGSLKDLTADQLTTFRARAVPQPGATVREPVRLSDPARQYIPGTVVCTAFPAEEYAKGAENEVPFLAALRDHPNLTYVDLPTGHWPMWSKPGDLSAVIAAAAEEPDEDDEDDGKDNHEDDADR